MDEHYLPCGTVVGVAPWTTHRLESVWGPDALRKLIEKSGRAKRQYFAQKDGLRESLPNSRYVLSSSHTDKPDVLPALHNRRQILSWYEVGKVRNVRADYSLALIDLRIIIGMLVRNFDLLPAHATTHKSMEPKDLETLYPSSGECRLHFTRRKLLQ